MFNISQTFFSCFVKRFIRMPDLNATDLRLLQDHVKNGDNLITNLKEEIKELIFEVQKKQESAKMKKLLAENKKLQNEINLVKKELIQLQVANGVPQIAVPGNETVAAEQSTKPSAEKSTKPSAEHSNKLDSEKSVKSGASDSKPAKVPKPKKQPGPAGDEQPIDISRLDIRVGKIVDVKVHPDATQLYVEQIEVGEESSRTVVSGLVKHIPLADLDQRMVVVLCNLKPQKMRGILSEAMVLCASTPEAVEVLIPPPEAKAGDKITVSGYTRNPDLPFMNPKKKIFEQVADDLRVNSNKQASYKDIPWQVEGRDGYVTVQGLTGCHIK